MPRITRKSIVIPGSQKSGTNNFFNSFSANPGISPCRHKEPHFFSLPSEAIIKNWDWYVSLYGGSSSPILEASQSYLILDRARENLSRFLENPYLIIVLRDPARRAFSAYSHHVSHFPESEGRSFREASDFLKSVPKSDFFRSVSLAEDSLIKNAEEAGRIERGHFHSRYLSDCYGAGFESVFEDPNFPFRYFTNSLYSLRVPLFEETFGSRVKIVFFEEYVANPVSVLRELYEFIEEHCPIEYLEPSGERYETLLPKNKWAFAIYRFLKNLKFLSDLNDSVKESRFSGLSPWLKKRFMKKPSISRQQYVELRNQMRPEYEYWENRYPKLKKYWN